MTETQHGMVRDAWGRLRRATVRTGKTGGPKLTLGAFIDEPFEARVQGALDAAADYVFSRCSERPADEEEKANAQVQT